MRKILIVILCALCASLFMQCMDRGVELYTIGDADTLEVNEEFLATDYIAGFEEEADSLDSLLIFGQIFFFDYEQYMLMCYMLEDWKEGRGDCQLVQLFYRDTVILRHIDVEGISCITSMKGNPTFELKGETAVKNDIALIYHLEGGVTVFILKSVATPEGPSRMPIFAMKNHRAVKVFNRNMEITSVDYKDKMLDITMQDGYQRYDTDEMGKVVPVGRTPRKYRLYSTKKGILRFKEL